MSVGLQFHLWSQNCFGDWNWDIFQWNDCSGQGALLKRISTSDSVIGALSCNSRSCSSCIDLNSSGYVIIYAAIDVYDSHELLAGIEFPETQICPAYPMTLKASLSRSVNKYPTVFSRLVKCRNDVLRQCSKIPLACNCAVVLMKHKLCYCGH